MPQVQTIRTVMFEVAQPVELDSGIVLPPGFYTGTETRIRLEPIGIGQNWTPAQYKIEFTADQLASMGAAVQANLISENIDVTQFVRSGQLIVA